MVSWVVLVAAIAGTFVLTSLAALVYANLASSGRRVEHRIEARHRVEDPCFLRTVGSLLGPGLLEGNRVTALENGDEFFPAMLGAIRSAERTITFESYIYWSGEIGREFLDALVAKARGGVRVHVLIDWAGSQKLDASWFEELRTAGAEVEKYNPPSWLEWPRLNRRSHRKILVIDGRIGFVGGAGIADPWRGRAQDPDHWRDTQFEIEGPAVAQLQAAFLDNWMESSREVLHGDAYFPELRPAGDLTAQVFRSSGDEGSESARVLFLLSISLASRSVLIGNAYFIPDRLSTRTLVEARRRGVEIDVLVPGETTDIRVVRHASRSLWGPLLEAGIRIHEYQPTMYHSKILLVDDVWVSGGSSNFDPRSFRLNDEVNLNVYDRDFARELRRRFEADLARSKRVTLQEWRGRGRATKLADRFLGLFRAQL